MRYGVTMSRAESGIDLFSYTDYREYLHAWYAWHKTHTRGFSFRAFSKLAGFASPNFLKLVMDGQRNLTAESGAKFAVALALNRSATEYFHALVDYTQANDVAQKNLAYERMLSAQRYRELHTIAQAQYEYFSAWYHVVVRELAPTAPTENPAVAISRKLRPQVTPAQVERSLTLLQQLGFLQRTHDGRFAQATPLLSTGAEVHGHIVMKYHQQLLEVTKVVLGMVPAAQRDVSAMTLGLARNKLPQLKSKIQKFRQELLEFVSSETQPEVVVQLNMQLFPWIKLDE